MINLNLPAAKIIAISTVAQIELTNIPYVIPLVEKNI